MGAILLFWIGICAINTRKIQKGEAMKAKTLFMVLVILSFSFSVFSQDAEELISQGDKLYHEMKDLATAKEARSMYQKAAATAENKYDAFWRIARINYYIGTHTESKKEKKTIFVQGVYWAQKAVDLEPEKPDGHYWHGVDNGKYGETRGVLKSLFLVKPIKKAMNKVIELDRSYNDGGADRVLGRVYFKLPGFAGGSKDKSLEHLLKSKEFGPEDPMTRLYLAETLLKFKEVEKARAEVDYILNMEDDDLWISGIAECKADAKELLKDKQFRKK